MTHQFLPKFTQPPLPIQEEQKRQNKPPQITTPSPRWNKPEKIVSPTRNLPPAAALSFGLNTPPKPASSISTMVQIGKNTFADQEIANSPKNFSPHTYNLRSGSNSSIGSTGSDRLSFQTAVKDNRQKMSDLKAKNVGCFGPRLNQVKAEKVHYSPRVEPPGVCGWRKKILENFFF